MFLVGAVVWQLGICVWVVCIDHFQLLAGFTTAPEETDAVSARRQEVEVLVVKVLCPFPFFSLSRVVFLFSTPASSLRISVAEVEFRDFVSILSVVKPSQVTDTSNEIVTR